MFIEHLQGIRECVILTPSGKKVPMEIHNRNYTSPYGTIAIEGRVIEGMAGKLKLDTLDRRMSHSMNMWLGHDHPSIQKVIFNEPATVVIWSDNSKTVVKCQEGDTYDRELGLAMCIAKKHLGNKGNFNDEFKKWIPEKKDIVTEDISIEDMRECVSKYCDSHYCSNCSLYETNKHKRGCFNEKSVEDERLIRNYNIIKKEI